MSEFWDRVAAKQDRIDGYKMPMQIRLSIDHMKAEIVQCVHNLFEASGDKERIEALVDEAIKEFDFEGTVKRLAQDHIRRDIDQRVGWLMKDWTKKNLVMKKIEALERKMAFEARLELGLEE